MLNSNIGAIITAAGYSSRMKAFKPLLPLVSSTIIETAINTFQSVGVREIVVITGNNAETLKAHIKYSGAVCLDSDYTKNTMFDSACIGLDYLKNKCDKVFFTPVDAPLFTRYSLKQMILKMNSSNKAVICPSYERSPGHPLLINANSFDEIMSYVGTCGMMGAIKRLKNTERLNLPDPALIMDADTPEDYELLKTYADSRCIPSDKTCIKLHEYFKTIDNVRKHCFKVASVASAITKSLDKSGYHLNEEKIRSAALLHDIMRFKKEHAKEGALLLDDLGYTEISPIVRDHMELEEYDIYHVTEKSVMYLADKHVNGDTLISLKDHFTKKLEQYKSGGDAYKSVEKRFSQAMQVEKNINMIINDEVCFE